MEGQQDGASKAPKSALKKPTMEKDDEALHIKLMRKATQFPVL